MTTTKPKLLTADDLLRLDSQGVKGELVRGVLYETMATGGEHGEIAMRLGARMLAVVQPNRLGRVFGTDSGVRLGRDPDTVREPDVAFISAAKLPPGRRVRGYYDAIPDLVAEIMSPTDTQGAIYDKARMWLSHGVALVLAIYPDSRTIDVHPAGGPVTTLTENDTLDGGAVLPGFAMPVREVFE